MPKFLVTMAIASPMNACLTLVWDWLKLCSDELATTKQLRISKEGGAARKQLLFADRTSILERHTVNRLSLVETAGDVKTVAERFTKQAEIGTFTARLHAWIRWNGSGKFLRNCLAAHSETTAMVRYFVVVFSFCTNAGDNVSHAIGVIVIRGKAFLVFDPNDGEFGVGWDDDEFWELIYNNYGITGTSKKPEACHWYNYFTILQLEPQVLSASPSSSQSQPTSSTNSSSSSSSATSTSSSMATSSSASSSSTNASTTSDTKT